MQRRDVIRSLALAVTAGALPRELLALGRPGTDPTRDGDEAFDLWRDVTPAAPRALSAEQLALVGAIGDVILPRTDSPSASDVGVPAFVDVIATGYYSEQERREFLDGLDAIEAMAQRAHARSLVALGEADRLALVDRLDRASPRTTPAERAYGRLKGLVMHGWYTSERVQQQVVRTQLFFGSFVGDAPHVVPPFAGAAR
ncbi:MAG: gluconate 2-dehydrogenase subunit 3 family protein [Gemmatimonadaceae bacterium]|jgi:hypothetical protein|nr:gluconate 2-dehydrogenase subunit 3 family protein [Gemmatimonadaceae bacterium]